jgi:hypothetical protein
LDRIILTKNPHFLNLEHLDMETQINVETLVVVDLHLVDEFG